MADGTEQGAAARGAACPVLPGKRWTRAREAIFFEALAATANVSHAARKAGMSPQGAYVRKNAHPAFAAAWRRALDIGFAELDMQLLRHALHGSERTETVIDGATGAVKQVKTVHSYPDAIAIRLLLAHREEVERYRQFEAARSGADDETAALVRAEMARVRERLIASGAEDDEGDEGEGGDDAAF